MASVKGQEKGIRNSLSFRTGIDLPYFQGMNLDQDPGAIKDAESQLLINVRLNAGRIDSRGGQEKLTEEALDGCVWSIDDLPLPVVGIFLTVFAANPTLALDRYNTDFDPNYGVVYQDALAPVTTGRGSIFVWRKKLLVAIAGPAGSGLYEVVLPKNGGSGDISVRLFLIGPVPTSYAVVPEGGDDILYMGTATGEVQRYDGTWYSTDGAVGTGTQIVGRFHDLLHSCGTTTLLQRQPGPPLVNGLPAPGTYRYFPLPISPFAPSGVTEWLERLFIVGRDGASASGPGHILIFDGATVVDGHIPSVTLNARNVSDAIVWNAKLWYVWRELGADPHTWIGTYDGATFIDNVADLGSTQSGTSFTGFFVLANGLLYVTTIRDEVGIGGGGSNSQVLMSSPDGTNWTLVKDISAYHAPGATTATKPPMPVVFG